MSREVWRAPMREGVSASTVQLPQGAWASLLDFLCVRFPAVDREAWRSRFARARVLEDGGTPLAEDAPYIVGRRIHYYRELRSEPEIPGEANILHRDARLLVVDKPHFLPVQPTGRYLRQTLLARMREATGCEDLVPLHRLDRDTAGVMLLSLDPASRGAYQRLFAEHRIEKSYEAVAPRLDREFPLLVKSRLIRAAKFHMTRQVPGDANSETEIRLLRSDGELALYALRPKTGKKHQLRVHMASLGAAIVNDPLYPDIRGRGEPDYARPLQLLARELRFVDPLSGEARCFRSEFQLALAPPAASADPAL